MPSFARSDGRILDNTVPTSTGITEGITSSFIPDMHDSKI